MRNIILATLAIVTLGGTAQAADKWYTPEQLDALSPRVRAAGDYNVSPGAPAGQGTSLSAERGFGATAVSAGKWYTQDELNGLSPRVREAGGYSVQPE